MISPFEQKNVKAKIPKLNFKFCVEGKKSGNLIFKTNFLVPNQKLTGNVQLITVVICLWFRHNINSM